MQATSSQVTTATTGLSAPVFIGDYADEEPGATILPVLTRAAEASKRSHLLVRRRKRMTRRMAR